MGFAVTYPPVTGLASTPRSDRMSRTSGSWTAGSRNPEVALRGMALFDEFDAVDQLAAISCPTLVCVGVLDPITPVSAAREIIDALSPGELIDPLSRTWRTCHRVSCFGVGRSLAPW